MTVEIQKSPFIYKQGSLLFRLDLSAPDSFSPSFAENVGQVV